MSDAWTHGPRHVRVGLFVVPVLCGAVIGYSVGSTARVPKGPAWVAPVASTAPPLASPSPTPRPAPSPSAAPVAPLLVAGNVRITSPGFWSWALLDRRTNKISGSRNLTATSTTASMIKAWLAADFLRRAAEAGTTPSSGQLQQLSVMIRDSENAPAHEVFQLLGGPASIRRLIRICGLTDSVPHQFWSNTLVSARDTARLADCIGDGRAAGSRWTGWLLTEMRGVRGLGDFGIRDALPAAVAARVAIKNGWVVRTQQGEWHVACLAIGDGWTLGVLARYPERLGLTHGAEICRSVAAQLLRA